MTQIYPITIQKLFVINLGVVQNRVLNFHVFGPQIFNF